jgi:UDP-N-acetylmuramoylalanine--D-glutamate ligase
MTRARTTLVVGAARSGTAAAGLVRRLGGRAVLTDDAVDAASLAKLAKVETAAPGIELVAPKEALRLLQSGEVAELVLSPGVPATHELVAAALARGLRVKSEIALAAEQVRGRVLAVTGTNGKSTVTTLLAGMLAAGGRRVFAGGNLGRPLSEAVAQTDETFDDLVVEVSSFQLEWPHSLAPEVAAVLNVTPDHLDRHGTMDRYIRAKLNLFANMQAGDHAVFSRDQDWWQPYRSEIRAGVTTFGERALGVGEEGTVFDGRRREITLEGRELRGLAVAERWPVFPHDVENVAAAAEMARLAGSAPKAIERGIAEFRPLPHRLAWVATHDGVRFFDDSKATNVGATLKSLEAFDEPVILLAGGVAKGAEFDALVGATTRLKRVIAYGEAAPLIVAALEGRVPLRRARGLEDAFSAAVGDAKVGDVVLLAPACASFDEFRNYAHRGERFVELVKGMAERRS